MHKLSFKTEVETQEMIGMVSMFACIVNLLVCCHFPVLLLMILKGVLDGKCSIGAPLKQYEGQVLRRNNCLWTCLLYHRTSVKRYCRVQVKATKIIKISQHVIDCPRGAWVSIYIHLRR